MSCTSIDWFSEWPNDALLEVAEKYLEEVNLEEPQSAGLVAPKSAPSTRASSHGSKEMDKLQSMHQVVASVFVVCHRSVVDMSDRMLFEMRRHNYVTPTNYLELVAGYKK